MNNPFNHTVNERNTVQASIVNPDGQKPKKHYIGAIALSFSAAAILFLVFAALFDGIVVRRYAIETDVVEGTHRFVVVADLHSTLYGMMQDDLVKKICAESPDAVLFVGDIAEEERGFFYTAVLLERLTKEFPCYFVAGNHERWLDYTDDIGELMESYGVTVLRGESVTLDGGIRLCGVFDPLFYSSSAEFLDNVRSLGSAGDGFDILLSHRPEYAEEYARSGMELTLCGHAHGGQVRIPLILNGLYAPHQGFFPKYAGGRYDFGETSVIVSRGLMIDNIPRVFNPPEIVVIDIRGK